jgi:DNA-binding CsgD family transcriptional regulator
MSALIDYLTESAAISSALEPERILDRVERLLRKLGASALLVTGQALPYRPISPLILRRDWTLPNQDDQVEVTADDTAIGWARTLTSPALIDLGLPEAKGLVERSRLVGAVHRTSQHLIMLPIIIPPYQGCIIAVGRFAILNEADLSVLTRIAELAFRRLITLGRIQPERPGGLSARERHVVSLTAAGKTASEIAGLLDISQRTVHAHLQNASDKLQAANKTQTVVKALLYGQIGISDLDADVRMPNFNA